MQKIFEGNRGEIFLTQFEGRAAILKKLKKGKPNTLENEAKILKYLEKFNIAPHLFFYKNGMLMMEYIDGVSMKEALQIDRKRALKKALKAAFLLDCFHIWHRELGRYYHFIFSKDLKKVKIVDFERAKWSKTPRNLFQFAGFYLRDDDIKDALFLYKKEKVKGYKSVLEVIDV